MTCYDEGQHSLPCPSPIDDFTCFPCSELLIKKICLLIEYCQRKLHDPLISTLHVQEFYILCLIETLPQFPHTIFYLMKHMISLLLCTFNVYLLTISLNVFIVKATVFSVDSNSFWKGCSKIKDQSIEQTNGNKSDSHH